MSAWAGGRTRIHCAINAWCAPDPLKDARVLPICQPGARERFGGEAGEIISFVPHPAPRRNASPWGFKHTNIQLTRWAGQSLWNISDRFNAHHSQKLTFLFRKWICRGILLLTGSFFPSQTLHISCTGFNEALNPYNYWPKILGIMKNTKTEDELDISCPQSVNIWSFFVTLSGISALSSC